MRATSHQCQTWIQRRDVNLAGHRRVVRGVEPCGGVLLSLDLLLLLLLAEVCGLRRVRVEEDELVTRVVADEVQGLVGLAAEDAHAVGDLEHGLREKCQKAP